MSYHGNFAFQSRNTHLYSQSPVWLYSLKAGLRSRRSVQSFSSCLWLFLVLYNSQHRGAVKMRQVKNWIMVSVTRQPYIVGKPLVTRKPVRCQNTTHKPGTNQTQSTLPAKSLFLCTTHYVKYGDKYSSVQKCFRIKLIDLRCANSSSYCPRVHRCICEQLCSYVRMERASWIWRQYRASVQLKPV